VLDCRTGGGSLDRKLALFVFNDRDEYHRSMAEEAVQTAAAEGLPLEVFTADDSAAQQGRDVMRFVLSNPGSAACVLVVPVMDAAESAENDANAKLARRVAEKGVGWITLNHGRDALVHGLRQQFPAVPAAMVVIDNVELGRIQGRQVKALLPQGGTVLCVRGNPFDSASRQRSEGMRQELAGSPVKIEETDGLWRPDVAEAAAYRWVTSPTRRRATLGVAVAQNDEMALAVRQALSRSARDLLRPELAAVPVLGGDGLPNKGRRWVDDGKLAATVCVTLPARPAIDLLSRHWRSGQPLPAVTSLTPVSHPTLDRLRPSGR